MADALIPELDVPVIFRQRPISIPGDLRPVWRISVIALLLRNCCRQGKSSLRRLHVLSWSVRDREVAAFLIRAIEGDIPPDAVLVRIEPALNRAVDFAIGVGMLRRGNSDRVVLTADGNSLADSITSNNSVLVGEKGFVEQIRYAVTEEFVARMFGRGSSS